MTDELPFPGPARATRALDAARSRLEAAAETAADAAGRALAQRRTARVAARHRRLRAAVLADPAETLAALRRALGSGLGGDRLLAEVAVLLTARVEGWHAVPPLLPALARLPGRSPACTAAALALLRADPAPGFALARPALGRPAALTPEAAGRIVLYSARFGPGPLPAPIFQDLPGLRRLLFSDLTGAAAPRVPGWTTVAVPAPEPDPARAQLAARIRGPALVAAAAPDAEASLWIDPELRVIGNLDTLLARWLWPQELALWRHPAARDWPEAVAAALLAGPADPAALIALAAAAEASGAAARPRAGAWDTRALWRRAGHDALSAAWWARAAGAPETADAAFALAVAETGTVPRTLPLPPAAAADGLYLAAAPWPAPAAPAPGRPARPPAGRRLPVSFLYAEAHAASASTFLRAGQLAELIAAELPEAYDIAWTPVTTGRPAAGLRDQVVILSKWVLPMLGAETLAALARRNVAVVGMWDDLPVDPDKLAATDAAMTLSYGQTLELARRFPGTPAFYVTHHVNRLIRPPRVPGTPPMDRLRTGYFGELANTIRPDGLAELVELVGINTSRVETDWIDRLPEFNAHWTIRQRRPIDGAKPFLKGFLAARCGAVVVAAREDEDALHYLGEDYPYLVRSLDPGDLEMHMAAMAEGFGGPDWRQAQAIMAQVGARSSDAVVAAEFRAMIDTLAG